jgi:hypothetical protein
MVNHYQKTVETAAKYGIALDIHEPVTGTGLRRTWPNLMSREGARGQEFNAWSSDGGNPPSHIPNLAFTRMLSGPMDFTPGIFNLTLEPYKQNHPLQTTLAQQLALYTILYSPLQMAADLPEHYAPNGQIHPAFSFIKEVGVDWETTRVLPSRVGDYVAVARQERVDFQGDGANQKPKNSPKTTQNAKKSADISTVGPHKSTQTDNKPSTTANKSNTTDNKTNQTANITASKTANKTATSTTPAGRWFIGIANDETPRTYALDFSFLPQDGPKRYTLTLYEDPNGTIKLIQAHNPPIQITTQVVTRGTVLNLPLQKGGGCAAVLTPLPN